MAVATQPVPDNKDSIWGSILAQAAKGNKRDTSTVYLLGGKDVGKSSLIHELQKIGLTEEPNTDLEYHQDVDSVVALDYAAIRVLNPSETSTADSASKMNVWMLQYPKHQDMLRKRISPQTLKQAAVVICLDLSRPWELEDKLTAWLEFTADFFSSIFVQLPVDEQNAARLKMSSYASQYRRNVTKETAEDFARRVTAGGAGEDETGDEARLPINLGIPIIVCVCKSDNVALLNTREDIGKIDIVEAYLRKICLPYGATLIFCNTKDDRSQRNSKVLYQYLCHRLHGFEFSLPAFSAHKQDIFFPSGWDTAQEIEQFAASTVVGGFDVPYRSVISRPAGAAVGISGEESEKSIPVEAMDRFLADAVAKVPALVTHQGVLGAAVPDTAPATSRSGPLPSATTSSSRAQPVSARDKDVTPAHTRDSKRTHRSSGGVGRDTARAMHEGTNRGDPESLRNFFHTLLVKKPGDNPEGSSPPVLSASDSNRLKDASVPAESEEKKGHANPAPTSQQATPPPFFSRSSKPAVVKKATR